MYQQDDTLRQRLRQHLGKLKEVEGGKDWLRDLVERLVQEILDIEFFEYMAAKPCERSEDLQSYGNGFCQREHFTRVSRLSLGSLEIGRVVLKPVI